MNVKEFEKTEKNTAKLTVEVTPAEFDAALTKAYLKERGKMNIPGFRRGKAPRRIIESMYGEGVFYEDAVEDLAPDALDAGIAEKGLETVGRPSMLDFDIGEDKSLTMVFSVSLYPEVHIGDYRGITAPKVEPTVTDRDVDREIERTRDQNARVETVDRAAANGDIAVVDFEGFIDGAPFEGGKDKEYDLELGSGAFIPGFEEQIVGHTAGESFDVNVTFPEAYAPEIAGKDATFKVTLREVKVKELPALDDEFAKDVSEYDTLEEYRESVRRELLEKREAESQSAFEEVVMARLVDLVECVIPDAMVEEQLDTMINNMRYSMSSQGYDLSEYLSMIGMTEEAFRAESRPDAEKQIKLDLAFEAIAKAEDFPVTDEEVEAEYDRLAHEYSMAVESVKSAISADSIKTGLKLERAKELVLECAKVAAPEEAHTGESESNEPASNEPESNESGSNESETGETQEAPGEDTGDKSEETAQ